LAARRGEACQRHLIDNVFPPIPSEVIMPLAGFAAARGQLSLIGVFRPTQRPTPYQTRAPESDPAVPARNTPMRLSWPRAAAKPTAGSLSGALVWYGVGRWVGRERLKRFAARHGRWLT
jgi:hypothetical protein